MKNVTISLPENLLIAGRKYAQEHHTSLNELIRELLRKSVLKSNNHPWLDSTLQLMSNAKGNSEGKKWTREDLYNG